MNMPNLKTALYLAVGSIALQAATATADQVFLDDIIVDGSACIGFDCVNGESFGFDTIRIKENNLRIRAQDTSSSASFPTNDWQITFNDSANGGANKFSIDDIDNARTPFTIEASAPSHSLYVDDGGRLGLGTSAPVVDVHVKSGNTPTLRLEQDGTSGFTPQTWDVAGNEANFFIRDATNGSTLPFRIRPGAPSSAIDIAAGGDVGIGTGSPKAKLHVLGTGAAFTPHDFTDFLVQDNSAADGHVLMSMVGGSTGTAQINLGHSGDEFLGRMVYFNAEDRLTLYSSGNEQFHILSDGKIGIGTSTVSSGFVLEHSNGAKLTDGGVWTSTSTREAKENILDLSYEDSLDTVMNLNPVVFNYKAEQDEDYAGFIAEDVPELVATNSRKNLVAMDIVAVLTKVVQQQQQTIDELATKVEALSVN